jgi:hypothetical protein
MTIRESLDTKQQALINDITLSDNKAERRAFLAGWQQGVKDYEKAIVEVQPVTLEFEYETD